MTLLKPVKFASLGFELLFVFFFSAHSSYDLKTTVTLLENFHLFGFLLVCSFRVSLSFLGLGSFRWSGVIHFSHCYWRLFLCVSVHLHDFFLDVLLVNFHIDCQVFIFFVARNDFQFGERYFFVYMEVCQSRNSQVMALPVVHVYTAAFG